MRLRLLNVCVCVGVGDVNAAGDQGLSFSSVLGDALPSRRPAMVVAARIVHVGVGVGVGAADESCVIVFIVCE